MKALRCMPEGFLLLIMTAVVGGVIIPALIEAADAHGIQHSFVIPA